MYKIVVFLLTQLTFYSCAQSYSNSSTPVEITDSVEVEAIKDPTPSLQAMVKLGKFQPKDLLVLIDKSDYTLQVYHKDSLLITYPCVFGFNPVDDKSVEGDGCTPEGDFNIRMMYAHKSWSYFIWIDYPNKESWRRFKKRMAEGTISKDDTIGGEIGIHGVPEGADSMIAKRQNWTLGCISLTNADMTDLYKSIGSSTLLRIVP